MPIYNFSDLKNFSINGIASSRTLKETTPVDHDQAKVAGDTRPRGEDMKFFEFAVAILNFEKHIFFFYIKKFRNGVHSEFISYCLEDESKSKASAINIDDELEKMG